MAAAARTGRRRRRDLRGLRDLGRHRVAGTGGPAGQRPGARALAPVLAAGALVGMACLPAGTGVPRDFREPAFGVVTTEGIVFGTGRVQAPTPADAELRLDLYEPAGPGLPERLPAVVLVHGGGFTGGSRQHTPLVQMAEGLAARGYVAVSIDYRLVGDDPLPSARMQPLTEAVGGPNAFPFFRAVIAAVDDTLTAFDWLLANADALSLDETRIAAMGESAGSMTVLHAAYLLDEWGIAPPPIAAVVEFWGGLFLSIGDLSPMEAGEPPLFATHGTRDTTAAFMWSEQLVARANEVGIPAEWQPLEGYGHGFSRIDPLVVEVAPGVTLFDRIVAFLHGALFTPGCLARTEPITSTNVVDADGDAIGNVCDGDFDQDGFVGGPDFDVLLQCFDRAVAPGAGPAADSDCAESDMNGDGFVGGPDFDLFLQAFGGPPG